MPKKLSISIVAYNNFDDIKNLIISMERYTSQNIDKKIYIIDNGRDINNTEELENFKLFLQKYKDIEYLDPGANLGFGKGHNMILQNFDSDYHAIVNPDILFCEDAFSSIIQWMDSNENVGMIIPNIIDENGVRQDVYREELTILDMFIRMFCKGLFKKREAKHTLQNKDYSKSFEVPFGQGSFLVIKSSLFKSLGGFDEGFFMYIEDADLCKRVNQVSKLMYYPGATVIHKWERGSHKNKTLFKYHVNSMRYYFKKWGYKII